MGLPENGSAKPVPPSGKKIPPPADVKEEVIEVARVPKEGSSKTSGMTVQVTKVDVTHYRHEDLLLKVHQINDSEIQLGDVSDSYVLFVVQSFCVYGFGQARGTIPVTTTTMATLSEPCEGALENIFCIFDKATSVVLPGRRHQFYVLPDLRKPADVTWDAPPLLLWCVTQHNGRQIAETEALKLRELENMVTSIVHCNFLFFALVKFVINFSEAFDKERALASLAANVENMKEDMVLSSSLTGN